MGSAYTLIASNILTGSASNVTFSNIPNTYTDLCLKAYARASDASQFASFAVTLNGSSAGYSWHRMLGNGGNMSAGLGTGQSIVLANYFNSSGSTSNTFGSAEFYFHNYLDSTSNKIFSYFGVQESRSSAALGAMANTTGTWSSTNPINSINLAVSIGSNFVAGSSFYLYGIKNS